ncbi:MAG: hypothetical protein HYW49_08005 [Deltaproteobacteria bacterium]|nr:hypothetical protein [Deltaproteobacteria bacterium]
MKGANAAKAPKKMRIAAELFSLAYKIKRHQLKLRHPKLSEKELHAKTLELIEKGCR